MISKRLFFLFLITLSCVSPDRSLIEIDPRTFIENKITLSEIADQISYLPLESQYSLGVIPEMIITTKSIFVDSPEGIIVFNREGKMARKIGNKGRGPGEYLWSGSFTVDDISETIYVMDKGNIIKVYSGSGNFLRSIPLQKYGGDFQKAIMYFNSKLFIPEFNNMGRSKYNWIITDTLGTLFQQKENSLPAFSINLGNWGGTFKFDNRITYWDFYSDTIFSILPDLSYNPSFVFTQGEHRLPKLKINPSQFSKYVFPYSIFETNRFIVMTYFFKKNCIALIEKNSKKSFLFNQGEDNKGGILNDLDGGTRFVPQKYYKEKGREYLIEFLNPFQLKAYVASADFKHSDAKFPEKKEELVKLANAVKVTDNPVLMIVRLKK